MHFSSKFWNSNKKIPVADLSKKLSLSKKKEFIIPLGNCFLDCFAKELDSKKFNIRHDRKFNIIAKYGLSKGDALHYYFGNFPNPLNLLHTLQRIVCGRKLNENSFIFSEKFNHYISLYSKTRFKAKSFKDIISRSKEIDNYLLKIIKKSTLILMSFDTNETWIDKKTKKAWYGFYGDPFTQKPYKNRAYLKVLNFKEMQNTITEILFLLKRLGNKKKFILMNSPNHITSTFQNIDVKIADSYSKNIFGSIFFELENYDNIRYFPSIELFNNYHTKKNNKYLKDHIHASNNFIRKVLINNFENYFFKK